MVRTKGIVHKQAMMGLPLVTLIQGRTSKGVKGKTQLIGVKWLDKIKAKAGRTPSSKR